MSVDSANKSRIEYLDVARGLTIIMIVIYHVLGETNLLYHHFVTTMCIELFVFVSGYFFHGFDIKKNLVKLVLPFSLLVIGVRLYWNFKLNAWEDGYVQDVLKQIILGDTFDELWQGQSVFVGIAWFLPMLVVARILYTIICKLEKDNYIARGCLALMLSCAGVVIGSHGYQLPWALDIAMAAMFFMFLGDFACRYAANVEALYKKIWFLPFCVIVWAVMVKLYGYGEFPFRSYPNGMTFLISSTLGVLIVLNISYFISEKMKFIAPLFRIYGKYSFIVLVAHVIDKSCIVHPADMNIFKLAAWELFLASIPMVVIGLFRCLKERAKNEDSKKLYD